VTLDKRIVEENGDGSLNVGNTTAVNNSTTAVNNSTTAVNLSTTATNQNAPQLVEINMVPSAPGVAIIAQYAAGAPINDPVGPFLTQIPARTCRVVLGVGGANPVVYTITGRTVFGGDPVTDVITATGPGTYEGDVAYDEILSFTSDVDPGGTTDLQTGKGFSLGPQSGLSGGIIQSTIGVDGVKESATVAEGITATVVPVTAPDGARVFTIRYTHDLTIIQDAHTHTQDAHTHTQVAHTHTQVAHTHTLS
jgi:hypothetical protein